MEYDIAEILEIRNAEKLLKIMQELFESEIGSQRFFRITGTPIEPGAVTADLEDENLRRLLEEPPNPHGRLSGWNVRPLPPLKRTSLGFENERIDYHHLKFIRNGHLEFWTAIDESFCWRQDPEKRKNQPRLYPYAVVEHPVSFVRLYAELKKLLRVGSEIIFQMQYLNVKGAILLPYAPENIHFQYPLDPVKPLERNRLVFPKRSFPDDFDPDPVALELIKDLYHEFGYSREHIPFFDESGHCRL